MIGLSIYLLIGAIIAYNDIKSADKWYENGDIDYESYLFFKYRKPLAFSAITLFWLPAIIWESKSKK